VNTGEFDVFTDSVIDEFASVSDSVNFEFACSFKEFGDNDWVLG
jgi:hypothetical protein